MPYGRHKKYLQFEASYLDLQGREYGSKLGHELVKRVCLENKETVHSISITTANLKYLLDESIRDLDKHGKLAWKNTPEIRKDVFITAWIAGMNEAGIEQVD